MICCFIIIGDFVWVFISFQGFLSVFTAFLYKKIASQLQKTDRKYFITSLLDTSSESDDSEVDVNEVEEVSESSIDSLSEEEDPFPPAATVTASTAKAATILATAAQTTNNKATANSTAAKAGTASPDIYGESPSPPPVPKKRARTRGGLTAGRGRGMRTRGGRVPVNDSRGDDPPDCAGLQKNRYIIFIQAILIFLISIFVDSGHVV